MASSRKTATNESVGTYGNGKTYTDLQTWEEATSLNLPSITTSYVLECYRGVHDDYDTLDGATCDVDYFRIIRPAGTIGEPDWQGHRGIPKSDGSCVEFHSTVAGDIWKIGESYSQWQDCVFTATINSSTNTYAFNLNGDQCAAVGILVYDCTNAGSGDCNGIATREASPNVFYIIDSLAHNCKNAGFYQAWTGTGYYYNCTAANNGRGFEQSNGTAYADNCIATDNTLSDWSGTWTKTTCTEEGSTITYVDSANDNFMLKHGCVRGTDLSSDLNYDFDDDILGSPRQSNGWSLGFHNNISSRRGGISEDISTCGTGKTHTTLQAWEEATDLNCVTNETTYVGEWYKGSYDDEWTIDTATCNDWYFRILRPAGTRGESDWEGHNGIPKDDGSCVEFHTSTPGTHNAVIKIYEDYTQVQDMVGTMTANDADANNIFVAYGDEAVFVACIAVDGTQAGAGTTSGFLLQQAGATDVCYAINCIVHNMVDYGFNTIDDVSGGVGYFYNCVADGQTDGTTGIGFYENSDTNQIAKNCLSTGNAGGDWSGSWTTTTCSAEDDTINYRDSANDDFFPKHSLRCGTNLSNDANYPFDDDMLGNKIPQVSWPLGPFINLSSRMGGVHETIATYGEGKTHSTLTGWETATSVNCVTGTVTHVLECYKDVYDDYDTFDGATTNSMYFRIIRPAGTRGEADWQGHQGIPKSDGSCVEFHTSDDTTGIEGLIRIDDDYSQVQDIVGKMTISDATYSNCFWAYGNQSAVVGCIAYDCTQGGAGEVNGFLARQAGATDESFIINCAAINIANHGFRTYDDVSGGVAYFYNCTADGCDVGFYEQSDTDQIAKNCISTSNNTDWSGSWTMTTCTEENNTITYVDSANDDFHLKNGCVRGTNLTNDEFYLFDDDIDGNIRPPNAWSMGFHNNISSRRGGISEGGAMGGAGTPDTYGSGKNYQDLDTWMQATDNNCVTGKISYVLECYKGTYDDYIGIEGATTNDWYFRIIRPAGIRGEVDWQGHNGIPKSDGSCVEFHTSSSSYVIVLWGEGNLQIQDLVGKQTSDNGSTRFCFRNANDPNGAFVGCIAYDCSNPSGAVIGFAGDGYGDHFFINCLAHNVKPGSSNGYGFYLNTPSDYRIFSNYAYNCTSQGNYDGVFFSSSSIDTLINFCSSGNTNDWNNEGDGTTLINCTAEDATPSYEASGSDDFHLASDDTVCMDEGKDLSNDLFYPFDDDIDGDIRS